MNKQMSLFQGVSDITPQKELGFFGICQTRLMQRKFQPYIKTVYLCDVFSGEGHNVVNGEVLAGSPIKMAQAIDVSGIVETKEVFLMCSDIRRDAIHTLTRYFSESDHSCETSIYQRSAADQLRFIHDIAKQESNSHFIITIDPNGPKTLPFKEIKDLSSDPALRNRIDFIVNISATSIKRMIRHRQSAGVNYDWWIGTIESIGRDLVMEIAKHYKGAWIRKPLGDRQGWLMVAYFNWKPPNNDWKKAGFIDLHSVAGKQAMISYEGK